jgi:Xaa-Pro dipeptidase
VMLTAETLPGLQALLQELELDGWLLFDFKGRNPVATAVLGEEIVGSRRVFVLVPQTGVPLAVVHEIDAELWRNWPAGWKQSIWVSQVQLERLLASYTAGLRLAIDYSPQGASPYLDGVPAGLLEMLRQLPCNLVPSVDLVTRFLSVWSGAEAESHERAAAKVAEIARLAMQRVSDALRSGNPISEFDVTEWILSAFASAGLVAESGPSVSVGPNAARNHYRATGEDSSLIVPGQLLLVDLWAKEPGGIYADQTWMASVGPASDRDAGLWKVIREARDAALKLLRDRIRASQPVTGAEVDLAAKQVIADTGFEDHVASRTGHSIDRYGLHGFGPVIDGTETRDDRRLISGVGFSIEPGVYFRGETGVRSEVNVYVKETDIAVTPFDYQRNLIVL